MTFRFLRLWVLAVFVSTSAFGQHMDIRWLRSIQQRPTAFKNNTSELISETVYPLSAAAPAALLVVGWIKKDRLLKQQGITLVGVLAANTVVTQVSKRIVDRSRPFVTFPDIVNRTSETGRYSFPSGHASTAWATATYLSLEYPKWYVIAPASIWAIGASWARMYEGVHYPSDVLAGAVLGAGTAWLGQHLRKKLFSEKKSSTNPTPAL